MDNCSTYVGVSELVSKILARLTHGLVSSRCIVAYNATTYEVVRGSSVAPIWVTDVFNSKITVH